MPIEGLRRNDDPGIAPLRADRLALALLNQQMHRPRRRSPTLGEWLGMALIVAVVIAALWGMP